MLGCQIGGGGGGGGGGSWWGGARGSRGLCQHSAKEAFNSSSVLRSAELCSDKDMSF